MILTYISQTGQRLSFAPSYFVYLLSCLNVKTRVSILPGDLLETVTALESLLDHRVQAQIDAEGSNDWNQEEASLLSLA